VPSALSWAQSRFLVLTRARTAAAVAARGGGGGGGAIALSACDKEASQQTGTGTDIRQKRIVSCGK